MTDNVIDFPNAEAPDIWGPEVRGHKLLLEGRAIPNIRILKSPRGVEAILDGRFSYEFPDEWAYLALHFAANAMAIGAGYPFLGADTKDQPFAPRCMEIDMGND